MADHLTFRSGKIADYFPEIATQVVGAANSQLDNVLNMVKVRSASDTLQRHPVSWRGIGALSCRVIMFDGIAGPVFLSTRFRPGEGLQNVGFSLNPRTGGHSRAVHYFAEEDRIQPHEISYSVGAKRDGVIDVVGMVMASTAVLSRIMATDTEATIRESFGALSRFTLPRDAPAAWS